MVRQERPDVVSISTQPSLHAEMPIWAAESNVRGSGRFVRLQSWGVAVLGGAREVERAGAGAGEARQSMEEYVKARVAIARGDSRGRRSLI